MERKKCTSCGVIQSVEQFYFRKDNGKLTGECRTCKQARSRVHYAENIERHHALTKARYEKFARFQRYRVTAEQYQQALDEQQGCCKLCEAGEPGGKGVWHIDHEHAADYDNRKNAFGGGRFRGLLCHRCNISLGHYENLVRRIGLDKLAEYLGSN